MSAVPQAPPPAGPPPARRGRTPPLARAYLAASGGWRRAGALLQAAYEGAWLGVLRREDLHRIDEGFYDENATYHGDAHNLGGLFPWEEEALADAFGGCARLLVIGAGGGREVLALSRRGHEVVGYECNQALVDYAAAFLPGQGCAARVHPLPRDAVPAGEAPFDGIIVGWSAYTLIAGRAHRVDLLRRLRPLVKPGGPVLLSFFTRTAETARLRTTARVANAWRTLLRRPPAELGDALKPNFVHYFSQAEVENELREAGWEPRRFRPHGPGGRDSGWAVGVARPAE